jgi:alpha-methylacyl-CoA racemase
VPDELRDDSRDAAATREAVASRVLMRTAEELRALFAGHDVCCSIIATLDEALCDPQFAARGLFARMLKAGAAAIPALPVPLIEAFRSTSTEAGYPELGEANDLLAEKGKASP